MPLYIGDYLADTAHLNAAEHGAYLLLIMHYWQKGSLPDDDCKLASIARAFPEQWSSMKATISEFFDGGWKHPRIDAELAKSEAAYQRRAEAGRKGGTAKSVKQCSSNAIASEPSIAVALHKQSHYTTLLSDLPNGKSSAPNGATGPIERPKEKPKRQKPDDDPILNAMLAEYDDVARSLGLPQTRGITSKREGLLRARAHDLVQVFGFPDPLIGMRAVMAKIRASPFLCDRRNRWMGLDWILNETNFLKIMEGTYEKGDASNGFSLHP